MLKQEINFLFFGVHQSILWSVNPFYDPSISNPFYDLSISHANLHRMHKRALPSEYSIYRHCLMLHKIFNNSIPKEDWLDLNFQMLTNRRQTYFEIQNNSRYKIGNNILPNRFTCLNKKIELNMLNLAIVPYKIKCKNMFLM